MRKQGRSISSLLVTPTVLQRDVGSSGIFWDVDNGFDQMGQSLGFVLVDAEAPESRVHVCTLM